MIGASDSMLEAFWNYVARVAKNIDFITDENKDSFSSFTDAHVFSEMMYSKKVFYQISVVLDISYIVDMTRCREAAGLELGLHRPTQHLFPDQ